MLLAFFSLNLIVCSLERIPLVLTILRKDNLATKPAKLETMDCCYQIQGGANNQSGEQYIEKLFFRKGLKAKQRRVEEGVLYFAEKGGWSRFGVYIVHTSILVILIGAVIGSATIAEKILRTPSFAFKGSIMLPETRQTDFVYAFKTGKPIDLGFSVRCDSFTIDYYDNGMPRTYLSKVTIIDDGKGEKTNQEIKVNAPLQHKGVHFYQSSYQPYDAFVITVRKKDTDLEFTDIITAKKRYTWKQGGVSFGILTTEMSGEQIKRLKIWFDDTKSKPVTFWVDSDQETTVERTDGTYIFRARQLYATGLQVTKDPGAWVVYLGCIMMLAGLYIAFFRSHRKFYAFVNTSDQTITLAGYANKDKTGFERYFNEFSGKSKTGGQQST